MIIDNINFINTCPHPIMLKDEVGNVHTIPQNPADLIRVHSYYNFNNLGPFRDAQIQYKFVEALPPKKENTIYIISRPTAEVLKEAKVGRDDFRVLGSKDKDNPKIAVGLFKF